MASAKSKAKAKSSGKSKGETGAAQNWLRVPTDRRTERRFLPSSNALAVFGSLLSGLGAVALGAGFFGQVLRKAGPHPYGVHLLVGGAVLFAIGFFCSLRPVPPIRVGDAGVAAERSGTIERLAWHDIDTVRLASGTLVFSGFGKLISIPVGPHAQAAWLALSETRSRVPARAAAVKDDLPKVGVDAGELVVLEEPQVAGLRCKASDRLIAFENDARLCGRCGEAYHKEEVPKCCLSCGAKLQ